MLQLLDPAEAPAAAAAAAAAAGEAAASATGLLFPSFFYGGFDRRSSRTRSSSSSAASVSEKINFDPGCYPLQSFPLQSLEPWSGFLRYSAVYHSMFGTLSTPKFSTPK